MIEKTDHLSVTLDFTMPITYVVLLCIVIALLDLIIYVHKKATESNLFGKRLKRKIEQRGKKGIRHYPFQYNGTVWMEGINRLNAQDKFLKFKNLQKQITKTKKSNGSKD
jgi:hypothetical protein